jgi:hypothetical protein
MIGSTFWKEYIIGGTIYGKTWLAGHFGQKNMISSTFWEKTWLAAYSGEKT